MKPCSVALLTLILGAACTLAAASGYPTAAPVKYIEKNETCPEQCFCTPLEDKIEVVCPTEETIDRIDDSPPKDVDPSEEVELLGDASDAHLDVAPPPEKISQEKDIPLQFPEDDVEEEFKAVTPAVVTEKEEDFMLPQDEDLMLSDQPVDGVDEDENVTEHEFIEHKVVDYKDEENPEIAEEVDQNLDAVPSEKPTEKAVPEEKAVAASVQDLEATPAAKEDEFRLPVDKEEEPEPTVAEVTASLSPLANKPDYPSSEESEIPDVPLVFNDSVEDSGSTEDVASPVPEQDEEDAPVTIVNKKVDNVETNNLVMMAPEMSGKMQVDEAPEEDADSSPQQSATSWVILGIILAMFVGVLLYAAIKGKVEDRPDGVAKVATISTVEVAKNRKPPPSGGEEGTEMKEMSRALLSTPSSPLESRVSRFIDEDCDDEQLKRFVPKEMDEILEQVVVEPQESPRPVNNAVEKPPRKFIHVPSSDEPERSSPNSPTLVHAKMVDMSPQVPRVISNGNSSNPFGEEE
ncbi:titin-like isoform X2 [Cloeon dipterum]